MSRRIFLFAMAASATLIATQASADRECFEDSCRQLESAEPAASSLPSAPVADESAAPEASPAVVVRDVAAESSPALEASAAAPKLTPAKALPEVVATPQVAPTPVPAPVKVVAAPSPSFAPHPPVQSFADHEPARLAPRSLKPAPAAAPAPVRVTKALPEDDVRAEPALPPAPMPPAYRPRRAVAAAAAPAIVAGPGAVYAEDDVVRVYPNPRHDPAWKVCQLDQRESDQRRCGAYSYHPYGANGYRPYGTYAEGRGTQVYMIAPSAKIIAVETED
jgi:hypothetical protein